MKFKFTRIQEFEVTVDPEHYDSDVPEEMLQQDLNNFADEPSFFDELSSLNTAKERFEGIIVEE